MAKKKKKNVGVADIQGGYSFVFAVVVFSRYYFLSFFICIVGLYILDSHLLHVFYLILSNAGQKHFDLKLYRWGFCNTF